MTRRYADPVTVETVLRPGVPADGPRAFRWRSRRYVVREVLAVWVAAGVWWRPFTATRASRERTGDRTVWRVETDSGVFDLARDSVTGQWSVVQVHD